MWARWGAGAEARSTRLARSVQGAALLAAVLASACVEPRLVHPADQMVITNRRGDEIVIKQKACGSSETTFEPVAHIVGGASIPLPLAAGCVDLVASTGDDTVVGRQDDVRMIPGAVWTVE